jgi:hypothetical protein
MWTARTVIAVLPVVSAIVVSADTSRPELRAIAALNDTIQQRFMTIDKYFGYARIAPPTSPHKFLPENLKETEAVRMLENAKMDVVLYLAGRRVLKSRTPDNEWFRPKGPLRIANASGHSISPPPGIDLWEDSREALLAFSANTSYEFPARDGWKMIARPVRAAGEQCLKCHTALRVGDPIGVVVYAYRGGAESARTP